MNDTLKIADKELSSRLIIGTGKFPSNEVMKQSIIASKSSMVTTALKRLGTEDSASENILEFIPKDCMLLPNTSGVRNAKEAVFAAKMSRELYQTNFIKLEIHPDAKYLLPDVKETLEATEILVKEGFNVMPYITPDPTACKQLEQMGAVCVMPLASPIGTNKGLRCKDLLKIIIEQSNVPVIIDAGLGTPSHAAEAMEMGADACMINTAIAIADDPITMAKAFALGIEAGRMAYLSGIASTSHFAKATSPLTAFLDEEQANVDKL
ncbi:MAG: thiazole synthase [Bacteroidales bacterium]|nr:thiazole synthase [Bacteroidales bacterium]